MTKVDTDYCNKCGAEQRFTSRLSRNMSIEPKWTGTNVITLKTNTHLGDIHLCSKCFGEFESTLMFKELKKK